MNDDEREGGVWRGMAWAVALSAPVWALLVWMVFRVLDAIGAALTGGGV